jgi:regulator of replication initiation timing
VSAVWFYHLVGNQFIKLRARLPGPIASSDTLVTRLRKEVAALRTQLRDLKARYESSVKEKLAAAVRHIELLDEENRMLREEVVHLRKRLNESKVVITPTGQD